MPQITDPPPQAVLDDLSALAPRMAHVPPKTAGNLLIATWNIRAFGDLTLKWASAEGDSPRRDLHAAVLIAEILSRFDVIAVQEVKANLRALRHVLKKMGPRWGFVMTDVTRGDPGNGERLAFIFDSERVKLSGLACELVVPEDLNDPLADPANAFQRQFVRTPYAVSFLANGKTFVLVTLHVNYGAGPSDRVGELRAIARWLRNWAEQMDDYGQNLICMGDFNIDRRDDPLWQAFTSTGLTPAPGLERIPRTLSSSLDKPDLGSFFDQIAWFQTVKGKPYLTLDFRQAGGIDFQGAVLTGLNRNQLSWRISDHYPLWVEFGV
ncbi:MAG: endonuclease/exonuclease/phosphatase family protein [Phenylobacterium sp.]|uniref:endonuclease/exonuclease/phosphatase family protein n=1 Tax=Phenylobacterium sp. TaxID=1871053 RepID=UPI001A3A0622|nr:endonuclease/exonuclease/phosphatase family protein [Phenylobacterium sp.]MBL8771233.1 endonuclease/exonuclease/phosphatase family protein [Phenylobacterium sp.]